MKSEKSKLKTYRLKISTIDFLSEYSAKIDRKQNWLVQKILDKFIEKITTKNQNK